MRLSGWGRFPEKTCRVARPRTVKEIRTLLRAGSAIPRGNGRAYGDSALSERNTVDMRAFNRMLAFESETGQLVAEAGVLLSDVIATFLRRGWFPPVTPGTKFVTLGGMIAADVHGKNHHKDGSFGAFVDWIDVLDSGGEVRRCSRDRNAEIFAWTIGGMGLTGIILKAAFRLRRVDTAWIRQITIAARNLPEAIEAFEDNLDVTYSAAWIDCLAGGEQLGRSLVFLGEHAARAELPEERQSAPFDIPRRRKFTVPLDAPHFALNRLSVRAFNALYFHAGLRRSGQSLVDWDSYFYPLDSILGWNRLYGKKGLVQFQCVLPLAAAERGLTELLNAITSFGRASILAVLKRFGPQDSRFSFPMEGYTLALDFPVSSKTLSFLSELDAIAVRHGGRFYLAKDSRMTRETLDLSDERVDQFRDMRAATASRDAFSSSQSERLAL